MIHDSRIRIRSDKPENPAGSYVLYWMQQSQRAQFNHALEFALREAAWLNKPVLVLFGVTDDYPEANERHYAFMLQGLAETQKTLAKRGLRMAVIHQSPEKMAAQYAKDACCVVMDRGYLRLQKQWREHVAHHSPVRVHEVESDVVVPVDVVSDKQEYAARTIRPKINRHVEQYLRPLPLHEVTHPSAGLWPQLSRELDLLDISKALAKLKIDHSVKGVNDFVGGHAQAIKHLKHFIAQHLKTYADARNEPVDNKVSHMSPYLHFGQISPVEIALRVREASSRTRDEDENVAKFLEELIVRRELSMNFVEHQPAYDQYACLPDWAKKTLAEHAADEREYLYTYDQLRDAKTHDSYWNAAQLEMVNTGKMHNYMRMYWGKKIIEWTDTPEHAFDYALTLNNTYELDGRDANSYAGVAWCFGLHDRPWTRRNIFGTVRYMNDKGLERKFDMQAYVHRIMASGDLGERI